MSAFHRIDIDDEDGESPHLFIFSKKTEQSSSSVALKTEASDGRLCSKFSLKINQILAPNNASSKRERGAKLDTEFHRKIFVVKTQ